MITEMKQGIGQWDITFRDIPIDVLQSMELSFFGHVVILNGHSDPSLWSDAMLTEARYVGVMRKIDRTPEGHIVSGMGMAGWLGDDDGKGSVIETAAIFTASSFINTIRNLLPSSGSIVEGVLHAVSGNFNGTIQWQSPREAITYVTDYYSTAAVPVEWRVNGDGTLDAGKVSDLYVTNPVALITRKDEGRDLSRQSLPGRSELTVDVEDYTTRVVLLAEGTGTATATGAANIGSADFRDLFGNAVALTRLVSESQTDAGNATVRAQAQLGQFDDPRSAVTLSTDTYDIKGIFQVGDYVYVYDVDSGFYDIAVSIDWAGQPINPIALRVVEATWPVGPGMTVLFRTQQGGYLDLTPYYVPEGGETALTVGALDASVTGLTAETVGARVQPGSSVFAPAAGTVSVASTAGVVSSASVTFATPLPSGMSYGCVVTANSTVPGPTHEVEVSYNSLSATGVTINIYRADATTPTTVSYLAWAF